MTKAQAASLPGRPPDVVIVADSVVLCTPGMTKTPANARLVLRFGLDASLWAAAAAFDGQQELSPVRSLGPVR